jgi:hypothetical protein
MSIDETWDERCTEAADLPADALELGVDVEGSTHHYSRIADTVVVETPTGAIERRINLEGRTLSSWIAYVDTRREWRSLNYAESFGDVLREALGGDN